MDAWTAFCLALTVFHFIAPDKKEPASAEFLPIFCRNVAAPQSKTMRLSRSVGLPPLDYAWMF